MVKTPKLVQRIFPKRIWAFPNNKNTVYLTFDDGPIPEATTWVLDQLKKYNYKATFFCIGDNIDKHSEVFKRILSEGHSIGNHTFHHLNGWQTKTATYIDNVLKTEGILYSEFKIQNSELLFRPPYGKLTSAQSEALRKKGFKIIMWDVLSADFDTDISEEKCLQNVLKNIEEGSIVVFHDSLKATKNLRYALPEVLKFISENNWESKALKISKQTPSPNQ